MEYNKMNARGKIIFQDPEVREGSKGQPIMNVVIATAIDDENKIGERLNIMISGEERIAKFKEATKDLEQDGEIAVEGIAYFNDKNFSLIANEIEKAKGNEPVNEIEIIGNLGRDVQVLQGKSGSFGVFSLAHNPYKGKEKSDEAMWSKVVVPTKVFEGIDSGDLDKGAGVEIRAKFQNRNYNGNDGKMVYDFQLVAKELNIQQKLEQDKKEEVKKEQEVKTEKNQSNEMGM